MKRAWTGIVLLAACSHGEPYGFDVAPITGAYQPGVFTQLTYNAGDDLTPAWFPDGSAFIYSTQRLDRPDHDRCLAVMPAAGGTISELVCQRRPANVDSMEVFENPSPGPDGRIAFMYSTYDLYLLTSYHTRDLYVAPLDSPLVSRYRRFAYPFNTPGVIEHDGVTRITWQSPTNLAYVATLPHYPQPCKFCRPDVATPVQIVLVDLSVSPSQAYAVPNTIFATSVAAAGTDTLYYTLLGDSRVMRRILSTGHDSVIHDFGGGLIVRDVQLHGVRLYAIVGGDVNTEFLAGMGWVQNDDGGLIEVLRLDDGSVNTVVGAGRMFRRAALSPDGQTLLAESRASATGDWDIWRIDLP